MSTEADRVDELLHSLEAALKELENAKGVRLGVIEKEMQNKLKQLSDLMMMEMLQGSLSHTRVLHVFGGDHTRIAHIKDVLERVMSLYSCKAEEQETQEEEQESHASKCLEACRSVEGILGIKLGDKRKLIARRNTYESFSPATPRRDCSGEFDNNNVHSVDGKPPTAVSSVPASVPGLPSATLRRDCSGEFDNNVHHSVDGQPPTAVGSVPASAPGPSHAADGPQALAAASVSLSMPGHDSTQSQQAAWMKHTKLCEICTAGFGIFTRRHHCRNCGRNVCNGCSPFRVHLTSPLLHPSKDDVGPHRVCVGCYEAGNSNTNNTNA